MANEKRNKRLFSFYKGKGDNPKLNIIRTLNIAHDDGGIWNVEIGVGPIDSNLKVDIDLFISNDYGDSSGGDTDQLEL